jgi:ribosomal protein S12 methylthiotransferase accessory factor
LPEGHRFCRADSNGCAAGNTLEEAILQGFLELVERDSVALWWYNRLRRPALDLSSFPSPHLQQLFRHYQGLGRDLWALDLTADLGIPAFAALSRQREGPRDDLLFGFGAHFDAQIALRRAVTEMNQMLAHALTMPQGALADERGVERDLWYWYRHATLANQLHFVPAEAPLRLLDAFPRWDNPGPAEDVRRCVALAQRAGLETLVLEQAQPDIGLPVVRVVVPGLRHFWARFAPGRLYDVPVRLGWLPVPTPEEQLNPIPVLW